MDRTTIDFGIDLGTTNSAIAVLRNTTPEVIKNNLDADLTPSTVYINRTGQIQVGQRARNRLVENPDDAYTEFKRRIGTNHEYVFKSSDRRLKPEELSAEVIKSLRADVQQRMDEELTAAVITVPAAFELHQCEATRRAAELAGLRLSPLLQEPVAAALAYGFQATREKAYWMVYDFGGGTFDAALVRTEDGQIQVVNHGGDPFLGGSDIDWAVVEKIVGPTLAIQYHLEDFHRGNLRWQQAFHQLKRIVEMAKIDLSRDESSLLENCRIRDWEGKDFDVEILLNRSQLAEVAAPIVRRSVDICRQVVARAHVPIEEIRQVILVGGPTLAPYFRDVLKEGLGLPLNFQIDPLTVVARGAAVFAGAQLLPVTPAIPYLPAAPFSLELKYNPIGPEVDPLVGGRVTAPAGKIVEGCSIEFGNLQTKWRGNRVPLGPDGTFMLNLLAEKGLRNDFEIVLLDAAGNRLSLHPDRLSYTVGTTITEQPIIHSMGVALANNQWEVYFHKGDPLPAKRQRSLHSASTLRRGESGRLLRIPVVEGGQELADRNRLLGFLEIAAHGLTRDLPAGSEIEVTLHMDASRILRVVAYVPLLDREYEGLIEYNHRLPAADFLNEEWLAEKARMERLRGRAPSAGEEAGVCLETLEAENTAERLQRLVEAASADPDAALQSEKMLLDWKVRVDELESLIEWPGLVEKARYWLTHLNSALQQYGSPEQREQGNRSRLELEETMRSRKKDLLRKQLDRLQDFYWTVVMAQPTFWTERFHQLILQENTMSDRDRATHLIEQGRQAEQAYNIQVLSTVVWQLCDLLPREVTDGAIRGYQSGVVR